RPAFRAPCQDPSEVGLVLVDWRSFRATISDRLVVGRPGGGTPGQTDKGEFVCTDSSDRTRFDIDCPSAIRDRHAQKSGIDYSSGNFCGGSSVVEHRATSPAIAWFNSRPPL